MLILQNYNYPKYNVGYSSALAFKANMPKVTKEQLEVLVAQGLKVSDICKQLNITASLYYYSLEKFAIKTPRKDVVDRVSLIKKEQILELIQSGKKYDEIAKMLGISTTTYNSLLDKFNIVTTYHRQKANIATITKEKLQALVDSGKKVKEICAELQIPERTYSRLLDTFGILTGRKLAKAHIASITREQFLSLIEQGFSKPEICKELKIIDYMFYKLLKRLNIPYEYLHHAREVNVPKQKLEELFQSGKTTSEIAKELGINVTTVHEKAKYMGVKTGFRDSIDKIASIPQEEFVSCLKAGMPIKDICQKFGISKSMYSTIIRKYNLDTNQRTSTKIISTVTKEQINKLKQEGKSREEIWTELKISESTYYRILNKA